MSTQAFVQVAVDGSGKAVDAVSVTTATGTTQYRQSVVAADGTFSANVQAVGQSGDAYVRSLTLEDLMQQVLVELRVMNTILQSTLNSRDDLDLLRIGEQSVTLQQTQ